jgi:hypothetical protein
MRVTSKLSLATLALVGACSASTMAKPEDTGAAPLDTASTTARDTSGLDTSTTTARDTSAQNPAGYRGMERDTTAVPPSDSSGRTVPGMAQPDSTTGQQSMDSTSGMDTTRADSSSAGR